MQQKGLKLSLSPRLSNIDALGFPVQILIELVNRPTLHPKASELGTHCCFKGKGNIITQMLKNVLCRKRLFVPATNNEMNGPLTKSSNTKAPFYNFCFLRPKYRSRNSDSSQQSDCLNSECTAHTKCLL